MGCADCKGSREPLRSEMEKTGLEVHSVEVVVSTIYRCLSDPVSNSGLTLLRDRLHLQDGKGLLSSFLGKPLRDLVVAGILLSRGCESEKAGLLFDCANVDSHKVLKLTEASDLVKTLFNVASVNMQLLLKETTDADKQYFETAQRNIPKAVSNITGVLFEYNSSIDSEDFVEKMKTFPILRPETARHYLWKQSIAPKSDSNY